MTEYGRTDSITNKKYREGEREREYDRDREFERGEEERGRER